MAPLVLLAAKSAGRWLIPAGIQFLAKRKARRRRMNGTKAWWASKGVLGPAVAGLCLVFEQIFNVRIEASVQAEIVTGLLKLIEVIGVVVGIIGRLTAKQILE